MSFDSNIVTLMNASTKGTAAALVLNRGLRKAWSGYELGVQGRSLVVRMTDALQGQ